MNVVKMCTALLLGLALSTSAGAGFQYTFDQASYSVQAGGRVDVRVFLQETIARGGTSVLATDGLLGAGVKVNFDLAPLPTDPAQVLASADVSGNGAFDDLLGPLIAVDPGVSATLVQLTDLGNLDGVKGTGGPEVYQLYLGTFTFTAGALAGEVTHLSATDNSLLDETLSNTGLVLDADIEAGFATITTTSGAITPVPEPASLTLALVGGLGLLLYRRRGPRHEQG